MLSLFAVAALALAVPADAPTPAALRGGLAGVWTGALGYRDYRTDKLFELPVRRTIATVPDGATVVTTSAYDDGPKTGTVWITTVELFDAKAGKVSSASFRKGETSEVSTEAVRVAVFTDATHWTLVTSETATDDDKPADIRSTETRDGATLRSLKEVKPVGAPDTAWRGRNQSRFTLVTPAG